MCCSVAPPSQSLRWAFSPPVRTIATRPKGTASERTFGSFLDLIVTMSCSSLITSFNACVVLSRLQAHVHLTLLQPVRTTATRLNCRQARRCSMLRCLFFKRMLSSVLHAAEVTPAHKAQPQRPSTPPPAPLNDAVVLPLSMPTVRLLLLHHGRASMYTDAQAQLTSTYNKVKSESL